MPRVYQNFTLPHYLIVGAFILLSAVAITGRRARPGVGGRRLDRGLAILGMLVWIAFQVAEGYPVWDDQYSWPLHVCDFAGLISPLALWTGWRPFQTIIHYWGLGLCTQAIVTPTLDGRAYDADFFLFWLSHGFIVGPALYDVFARGYRPRFWPDAALISVVTIGYLLLLLPIDLHFGWNFGYVGNSIPGHPTLLDSLGPWPQRLWLIIAGVAVVFISMTLPWELWRVWKHRSSRASE